jgi:Tfp pilus assembly protein PilO
MKNYRRQRQQFVFAGLLVAMAVVNVLFYFILFRPARSEYFGLQESIRKTRAEAASRRLKIGQLEKLSAQLETFAQDRSQLITRHFLPRTPGWSQLLPLLEASVQKAGVKNQKQNYSIDPTPQYGLYSVKITVPVIGRYPNIVNILKELEESQTFFIINSIDVEGGTDNAPTSDLGMALNLETFFYYQ